MRMIGTIPDEQQARRFGDYLLAQQIPQTIETDAQNGWAIWVHNDDDLDSARQELEAFQRAPNDPKYNGASKVAAQVRADEEKRQKRLRKNYVDVRTNWTRGGGYPVTIVLIGICALVFGLMLMGPVGDQVLNWLLFAPVETGSGGQLVTRGFDAILHGQIWRLVTPIFIHFGILHFIFNMFWLRDLGGLLEHRRGSLWLAGFVVTCAIISNLAQFFWIPDVPTFGGMSGVVYGLFGYAWMKSRYEPHLGIHLHPQTVMIMLAWLVLAMTPLLGLSIANAAHVGGLLVGIIWGYGPIAYHRWRRKLRQ